MRWNTTQERKGVKGMSEAVEQYNQLKKLFPTDKMKILHYFGKALTAEAEGKKDEAEKCLAEAVKAEQG